MAAEHDVVVVGAGLAGLSLALRLSGAGLDVKVIEARDRVGGRLLSQSVGGSVVDFGGQWMSENHHRLADLAAELDMQTFAQFDRGARVLDIDGRVMLFRGREPALSWWSDFFSKRVWHELGVMAQRVPLDQPFRAQDAAAWDALTLDAFVGRRHRDPRGKKLFDLAIHSILGVHPSELSLLYFLFFLNSVGGVALLQEVFAGARQRRFVGGAQMLTDRLVDRLGADRVQLGAPIKRIMQEGDGVVVESTKRRWSARRVVVAIPPHLSAGIAFEPALPENRVALAKRWPMSPLVKVQVVYESAGWRALGYSGRVVSADGPLSQVFDSTSGDGRLACLGAFVVGQRARTWSTLTVEAQRAQISAQLERQLEMPASSVVDVLQHDWSTDRCSGGGWMATMGPGVLMSSAGAWRQPVGRVHWAGTETARHHHGFMEGALESSERVASQVIEALG